MFFLLFRENNLEKSLKALSKSGKNDSYSVKREYKVKQSLRFINSFLFRAYAHPPRIQTARELGQDSAAARVPRGKQFVTVSEAKTGLCFSHLLWCAWLGIGYEAREYGKIITSPVGSTLSGLLAEMSIVSHCGALRGWESKQLLAILMGLVWTLGCSFTLFTLPFKLWTCGCHFHEKSHLCFLTEKKNASSCMPQRRVAEEMGHAASLPSRCIRTWFRHHGMLWFATVWVCLEVALGIHSLFPYLLILCLLPGLLSLHTLDMRARHWLVAQNLACPQASVENQSWFPVLILALCWNEICRGGGWGCVRDGVGWTGVEVLVSSAHCLLAHTFAKHSYV